MGIKEIVESALGTAFNAVGNVRQDIVLTRRTGTTYDPTTGLPSDIITAYGATGIFLPSDTSRKVRAPSGPSPSEFDGPDKPSIAGQLLVRVTELAVRPRDLDQVTLANGSKYVVQSVSEDPTGNLYTLNLA